MMTGRMLQMLLSVLQLCWNSSLVLWRLLAGVGAGRHPGWRWARWSLALSTGRHLLPRGLHLLLLQHESKARIARRDSALTNRTLLRIAMTWLAVRFAACHYNIVSRSRLRSSDANTLCFLLFLRWPEPFTAFQEPLIFVFFATNIMNLNAIVLQLDDT